VVRELDASGARVPADVGERLAWRTR
jgi:hypothetical protein